MTPLETLSAVLCDPEGTVCVKGSDADRTAIQDALKALASPIDMVLFCPRCGTQHLDEVESIEEALARRNNGKPYAGRWFNEPHRSHLCKGCDFIWRPADVATNGVLELKTRGRADTPFDRFDLVHDYSFITQSHADPTKLHTFVENPRDIAPFSDARCWVCSYGKADARRHHAASNDPLTAEEAERLELLPTYQHPKPQVNLWPEDEAPAMRATSWQCTVCKSLTVMGCVNSGCVELNDRK